jgi:antitoxin YefM
LQASAQLLSLIEQVNKHLKPVIIQSNAGNAVLISQSEYLSMIETIDLLSTPANRDWLLESLAQADRGELLTIDIPIQLVKSSPNSAKKKF